MSKKEVNRQPGRPTSLEPTTKKKLLYAISMGMKWDDCCSMAGICYKTFRNWITRGEKEGEGMYFQFLQELKRAQIQGKAQNIKKIMMNESWQSKAWLLERQYPNEFGRRVVFEGNPAEESEKVAKEMAEIARALKGRYKKD